MRQLVEICDTTGYSQARRIRIVLDVNLEFNPNTYEYIVHIPEQRYRETAEMADLTYRVI